jgi:molybdopterin/thiamine biosynthesis adenylyltransferase
MKPAPATQTPLTPVLPDNASIKIIGLGGVGRHVAPDVCVFLAAQNRACRVVLIDGDKFEPSNASRMLFRTCGNKAAVARDELMDYLGDSQVALIAVEEFVTPDNVARLVRDGDIVFVTVDNHATRKLINDHCGTLANVCVISGGNDGVADGLRGTYGNVQVHLRRDGMAQTPSLTQYHPEIENPGDHLPTDKSCTELIASVPQILFANVTVAAAMLNTFWLHLCGGLHYSELAFDIAEGRMQPVLPLSSLRGESPGRQGLAGTAAPGSPGKRKTVSGASPRARIAKAATNSPH